MPLGISNRNNTVSLKVYLWQSLNYAAVHMNLKVKFKILVKVTMQ